MEIFLDLLVFHATCHNLIVMENLCLYLKGRHQIYQSCFFLNQFSVSASVSLSLLSHQVTLPCSLFSFIENFGTHIVTSVTIGGKDEIYIKQHHSSQLSASDIEKYVKDIGGQRFLNLENHSSAALFNYEDKVSVFCYFRCMSLCIASEICLSYNANIHSNAQIADPSLVNNRDMQSYASSVPHLSGKEVTIYISNIPIYPLHITLS